MLSRLVGMNDPHAHTNIGGRGRRRPGRADGRRQARRRRHCQRRCWRRPRSSAAAPRPSVKPGSISTKARTRCTSAAPGCVSCVRWGSTPALESGLAPVGLPASRARPPLARRHRRIDALVGLGAAPRTHGPAAHLGQRMAGGCAARSRGAGRRRSTGEGHHIRRRSRRPQCRRCRPADPARRHPRASATSPADGAGSWARWRRRHAREGRPSAPGPASGRLTGSPTAAGRFGQTTTCCWPMWWCWRPVSTAGARSCATSGLPRRRGRRRRCRRSIWGSARCRDARVRSGWGSTSRPTSPNTRRRATPTAC